MINQLSESFDAQNYVSKIFTGMLLYISIFIYVIGIITLCLIKIDTLKLEQFNFQKQNLKGMYSEQVYLDGELKKLISN